MLIGIDIGTTHLKAGLFNSTGQALAIDASPNPAVRGWKEITAYDPEALWERVCGLVKMVCDAAGKSSPVESVGVVGMAETGLLVDRASGRPRTPLIPWFETCAAGKVRVVKSSVGEVEYFLRTGLHAAAKYSLMKLLWLQEQERDLLQGCVWLSAADWVVYRMCGEMQTDFTLAERTGAFNLAARDWDGDLLERFGLPEDLFPSAAASGTLAGGFAPGSETGIPAGTPIAVAGHDHVCGAWAAAAASGVTPAPVFDSIGTAEALIGLLPQRALSEQDFRAGFSFGLACDPNNLYWQGGLSTSGGSLGWISTALDDSALDYAALEKLAAEARGPTGILYYPYLAGSGSPHSDSAARGAFLGLGANHTRADLCRAVLEGCAFEMEYQRRRAVEMVAASAESVIAAGGGTRNRLWMQIKADVFGCPVEILEQEETSLLGAALLAGGGAGILKAGDLADLTAAKPKQRIEPDPERSRAYRNVFEQGFLAHEELVRSVRTGV